MGLIKEPLDVDFEVDPRPLIAATISMSEVGDVFLGKRPVNAGDGPKIHIDPRI